MCMLSHFRCVRLFATLWTVACQAPLSMGFSRQEELEWVGMPSSRGSSQLRKISYVSTLADGFFTTGATWEVL